MPFVLHRTNSEPVAVPEPTARRMVDESVGTGELGKAMLNKLIQGEKVFIKDGYLLWVREGEEPKSRLAEAPTRPRGPAPPAR